MYIIYLIDKNVNKKLIKQQFIHFSSFYGGFPLKKNFFFKLPYDKAENCFACLVQVLQFQLILYVVYNIQNKII